MATATPTKTEYRYIVQTPELFGGEARIDGHRIRVRDIVLARDLGGLTPEEVAGSCYPDLSLAQIYSALAYYEDHRGEIDRAGEAELEFAERFLREHPTMVVDCRAQRSTAHVATDR